MNVRYLVSGRLSADKFDIDINDKAFLADVIIGFPHLVLIRVSAKVRSVRSAAVPR